MTILSYILGAVCLFLIICPPRFDPAIRWKERMEDIRREREKF